MASLHDGLTVATVKVTEKKANADITKSAVVETSDEVAEKEDAVDAESREATAAWEKASFDLSVVEKKAEVVEEKIAAARDAGDAELVARVEKELETVIKAVAEATVAEREAKPQQKTIRDALEAKIGRLNER